MEVAEQRLTIQEWAQVFGSRRSERKAAASRANGKKGGRPKSKSAYERIDQIERIAQHEEAI